MHPDKLQSGLASEAFALLKDAVGALLQEGRKPGAIPRMCSDSGRYATTYDYACAQGRLLLRLSGTTSTEFVRTRSKRTQRTARSRTATRRPGPKSDVK